MNDLQLLTRFVREKSQDAFRELVQRHANWLYTVCLRRLRDPALAEDATQTVFFALARKAPTLLHQPTLSPWLHQAAKFASANLQRARQRRAHHEMEASAMTSNVADTQWPRIESDLETALDRLRARDRQTLLLRFYEQRSHAQIASTLHITEAAAHKRLERALDRLRSLLLARGHHDLSAVALPALLLSHAVTSAPACLTAALATASTGAIPIQLVPATKSVLHMLGWLKVQFWAAAAAATAGILLLSVAALGVANNLLVQSPARAATAAAARGVALPIAAPAPKIPPMTASATESFVLKLHNVDFLSKKKPNTDEFQIDTDPAARRTPASEPANHIRSLVNPLLQPDAPAERTIVTPASLFRGKRIRLSAWVKTAAVRNWATLRLYLLDASGRLYIYSDMAARPIHGTTDWQQYELVEDVPNDASMIGISTALYGTGEVWSDDFQISVAPANTPTTDDQNWLKWSFYAPLYAATPDASVPHDGHPSICLAYVGPTSAPKDAWGQYDHMMRLQQYGGHRLRISVYMKTENAGFCGPTMRTVDSGGMVLTRDKGYMHRTLRGTHDWNLYSTECDIPKDATAIDCGVVLNGKGKVWIDLDSVKYEIVDSNKNP